MLPGPLSGVAALGLGAGLIGGALIAGALMDDEDDYEEGFGRSLLS